MKLTLALLAAVTLTACSQSERLTSPSSTALTGNTRSTADNAATGSANISEPTEAPRNWTFVQQGEQHPDFSFSVAGAWTAVKPGTSAQKSEVEIQWLEDNTWHSLPLLGINHTGVGTTKFQAVLPNGGQWRARVRNVYPDGLQGAWTAFVQISMPQRIDNPERLVTCWWDELGAGFWALRF